MSISCFREDILTEARKKKSRTSLRLGKTGLVARVCPKCSELFLHEENSRPPYCGKCRSSRNAEDYITRIIHSLR